MIVAAKRRAWALAALALLAALPIGWHTFHQPTVDLCADSDALFASNRLGGAVVTAREVVGDGTGSLDGQIRGLPDGVTSMDVRLQRSFEPSEYYGESAVHEVGDAFWLEERFELGWIEADDGRRLPVYSASDTLAPNHRLRSYMVIWGRRPTASPFLAGLARGPAQLLRGTRPVSLLIVRADGLTHGADAMLEMQADWIRKAWGEFERACGMPD